MDQEIKRYVIGLLEDYPDTMRKIALLRYELEHPVAVSADEIIEAMIFARGEGGGRCVGHVSDKTRNVALSYQDRIARENRENREDIIRRLVLLEHEVNRLEHYMGLLTEREMLVIRQHYFERLTWDEIAENLFIARRTAQITMKGAVEKLVEMYQFVSQAVQ